MAGVVSEDRTTACFLPTRWIATPAKINVHLEITDKRPDGYHEIQTLILAVNLYDTLEVVSDSTSELSLQYQDPSIPTDDRNFVVQAAKNYRNVDPTLPPLQLRLTKRIPQEAGLGGGSSDAAATLRLFQSHQEKPYQLEQLMELGAKVGSDVPFFLNTPAAWCTGRGEKCQPIEVPTPYYWVLVKPPFGCPTRDVYSRLQLPSCPRSGEQAISALQSGQAERVATTLFNRLYQAALDLRPELADIATRLERCGPLAITLCGSGSTLAALCANVHEARLVAERYRSLAEDRLLIVRSLFHSTRTKA